MAAWSSLKRSTRAGLRRCGLGAAGCVVLAVLGLVAGPVASAGADQLFSESFTHPTVSSPALVVGASGGGAPFQQVCLTAGTSTTQTPIPGCTAGQASIPAGGDPDGAGALRLTDNENNVAGYVLDDSPLPLTAGLDISFDYYSYNTRNSVADGLSFFLTDGAGTLTAPGANGGSLGYAQRNGAPGVANGYLGLGLDEYGNYTNDTENRGNGCATRSPLTGLHPSYVGLRGPGNGLTGYCLLSYAQAPAALAVGAAKTRTAAGVEQAVEIKVSPPGATNPQVTVLINGVQVLQAPEPPNPPSTFKFGFAASTGGSTDIHEIQNVQINTLIPLPALTVSQTANGPAVPGQNLTYTLQGQVAATGGAEGTPVTITNTLPAGVTVSALPTGPGWDCSATVVGSSQMSCTYTPDPANPSAPGTALPPISLPTHIDPSARGPLTSPAVISSTDNANTVPQSTGTSTVTAAPAVNTAVTVTPPTGTLKVGEPATFHISVVNTGPSTATSTTVRVPVPPGSTFTAGPPGCALHDDAVICDLGTLMPGASATSLPLTFTPSTVGPLTVSAIVTQTEPDTNPADNTAAATATITGPPAPPLPQPPPARDTSANADAYVQVTPPSTPPVLGQPTGFTITVGNKGPSTDTGVVVSIPIPSGSSVVSLAPQCRVVSSVILCVAGNLDSGANTSFAVVIKPNVVGPVSMTATVTGNLPDTNPANNVATATRTVTGTPSTKAVDLLVAIKPVTTHPQQGSTVGLRVTVANNSSTTGTGVVVSIPLPAGSTPISLPAGCTRHGTVVICEVGKLPAHAKRTFTIGVRPNGSGPLGATATVRGDQRDPKPRNNHASAQLNVAKRPQLHLSDHINHHNLVSGSPGRLILSVSTSNHTTARNVMVCDVIPHGLHVVSAPGGRIDGQRVCFTISRLTSTPHKLTINVTAGKVTHSTVLHDHATAQGSGAHPVHASTSVVIVRPPVPSFTG